MNALTFGPSFSSTSRDTFDPRKAHITYGTLPASGSGNWTSGFQIGKPVSTAPARTSSGLTFGNTKSAASPFAVADLSFNSGMPDLPSFFTNWGTLQLGKPVAARDTFDPRLAHVQIGTLPATRSTGMPQVNTVDIDGGVGALDGLRDMASGIMGNLFGGGDTQTEIVPASARSGTDGLLSPMNLFLIGALALGAYYVAK